MPEKRSLLNPVETLSGIGPVRKEQLAKLGIETISDLLHHCPREHEDRSNLIPINECVVDEPATICAEIISVRQMKNRRWRKRLEVTVRDESGQLKGIWFNQAYLKDNFKRKDWVLLSGKVSFYNGLQMASPSYEAIDPEQKETGLFVGCIVPIYPLTDGITQNFLRQKIREAIEAYSDLIVDPLDNKLLKENNWPDKRTAILNLHKPEVIEEAVFAKQRLAYEEFFLYQLANVVKRQLNKARCTGRSFLQSKDIDSRIRKRFPFEFTNAQNKAIDEISKDMSQASPMNRLLQGDVGSGKTAVALYAMLLCIANKSQTVIMAPTEILAQQHFETISEYLKDTAVNIVLLAGSMKESEKKIVRNDIQEGKHQLIIGTHALIQEKVNFNNLGLVIIDEQHKFGVAQRSTLLKKGNEADLLLMSATPIPRSMAMTIYGDLDVSIIDELPPGRKPVKTKLVQEAKREAAYDFIRDKIENGCQVYAVYPLIEESEKLDLKNATEMANHFAKDVYPDLNIGLLHGKLKPDQKKKIMDQFNKGNIHILVSTVVIEVGVNVPNANIMVIEESQRFGLAQIHQLRGRIGRGSEEAFCFLFAKGGTKTTKERLRVLTSTADGFKVSEADLQIRGPGDFLGTRQHGFPQFSFGDILEDFSLMEEARRQANDNTYINENGKLIDHWEPLVKPYLDLILEI